MSDDTNTADAPLIIWTTGSQYIRKDEYDRVLRERDQYKLAAELNKQTIEAMSRGEYICSNCGIRKDGEHDHAVEF